MFTFVLKDKWMNYAIISRKQAQQDTDMYLKTIFMEKNGIETVSPTVPTSKKQLLRMRL